jgi:NAD(P)-dependent dehydrogenase (short-subunit alcohol dehydrogenase family)
MSEIALVTGGARGIGFGVSKALAKEGVDIAVFGTRGADAVADAMAEIAAFGVCYGRLVPLATCQMRNNGILCSNKSGSPEIQNFFCTIL